MESDGSTDLNRPPPNGGASDTKEERVARISARQAITVALKTAFAGLAGAVIQKAGLAASQ